MVCPLPADPIEFAYVQVACVPSIGRRHHLIKGKMEREPRAHVVEQRYLTQTYFEKNQSWDIQDSPWKARHAEQLLKRNRLEPKSISEIGCGAGEVLKIFRSHFPDAQLSGFDIAPSLKSFWQNLSGQNINFVCGDFRDSLTKKQDLILMLDVLEHVADPHKFLVDAAPLGRHFLFHFPLDLSAISVLRETPLLNVRRSVGHIHYFTKRLAFDLLNECDFDVIDYKYSGAFFSSPSATLKTKLAALPRLILSKINPDLNARLLGGETLFVLAAPKNMR